MDHNLNIFNNSKYIGEKDEKVQFSKSMNNFYERYSLKPINIPKEGIPLNKLVTELDKVYIEKMKCFICSKLAWNFVDCTCGTLYCKYCFEQKSSKNNRCLNPKCNKSLFNGVGSGFPKKIFGKIKIKCDNINCNETPDYDNYIGHLEKCKYRLYKCNNEGCNFEDTIDGIKDHCNKCEYRKIQCKYCKKEIIFKFLDKHIQQECQQNIECPLCHITIKIGDYNRLHKNDQNENVDCLKGQVKYYKEQFEKEKASKKEKINEFQSLVSKLYQNIDILKKEKLEYSNKIKELKNTFLEKYNKLINKNPTKEEKNEIMKNNLNAIQNEQYAYPQTFYYRNTESINEEFTPRNRYNYERDEDTIAKKHNNAGKKPSNIKHQKSRSQVELEVKIKSNINFIQNPNKNVPLANQKIYSMKVPIFEGKNLYLKKNSDN